MLPTDQEGGGARGCVTLLEVDGAILVQAGVPHQPNWVLLHACVCCTMVGKACIVHSKIAATLGLKPHLLVAGVVQTLLWYV